MLEKLQAKEKECEKLVEQLGNIICAYEQYGEVLGRELMAANQLLTQHKESK